MSGRVGEWVFMYTHVCIRMHSSKQASEYRRCIAWMQARFKRTCLQQRDAFELPNNHNAAAATATTMPLPPLLHSSEAPVLQLPQVQLPSYLHTFMPQIISGARQGAFSACCDCSRSRFCSLKRLNS